MLVTITTSGQGGGMPGTCKRCAAVSRMGRVLDRTTEREDAGEREANRDPFLCSCWCRGWAEIKIRRPTGNIAWLLRLQNRLQPLYTLSDTDYSLVAANYPFMEEETATSAPLEASGDAGTTTTVPSEDLQDREPAAPTALGGRQEAESEVDPAFEVAVERATDSDGEQTQQTSEIPQSSETVPTTDSDPLPLASIRQPTSMSWSEVGESCEPLSPRAASYSALPCLEYLPPLLSYDEGDGLGRSPSLRDPGGLMSEQEQVREPTTGHYGLMILDYVQLNLMAASGASEQSSSDSESTATPTPEEGEGVPTDEEEVS